MGVAHSQASAYVKEMQKWEMRPVMIGDTMIMPLPMEKGGRADAPHQEYPKMLYRAERADGGPKIAGFIIADTEREASTYLSRGWNLTQDGAIAAVHAQDVEFARLAANRAYQERTMSEKARQEAADYEGESMVHTPVIPEVPIKRRGRPAKTQE